MATLLPADVSSGFDNIASALTISPTLMDRYLTAAQKIARLAVGTPTTVPNVDYFRLADDLRQDDHLPGMPFGTRGGTRIRYTFPVDGEYVIRVRLARDLNESMPPYAEPQQLEVSLDGEQLEVFTLAAAAPAAGRGRGAARNSAPSQPDMPPPPSRRCRGGAARPMPQPPRQRPGAGASAGSVRLTPSVREQRNRADQNWDVRVPVKAGDHEIVVAFLKRPPRSTKRHGCRSCARFRRATTSRRRAWAQRCER